LRLHGWHDPAILATGALAAAAGFARFGATSALADVARSFGKPSPTGISVAAEVGLSFTILGVGLGTIRLAALADRVSRRRMMLGCTALGWRSPPGPRSARATDGSWRCSPWAGPCWPARTPSAG
jgi:hypothetical protein